MEVYAYRNKLETTMKSSSGGAFLGIVKEFWNENFDNNVVYGALFDKELNVRHERAINFIDCEKFCGSKYVQSNINGIFEKIINDLNEKKRVVFSGTPCQIYALKNFLNKKNINVENLYTIDFICHGTPNPKIWKDYKYWLEKKYKSRLIDFSFRYKGKNLKKNKMAYPIKACFSNGKIVEDSFYSRLYIQLFFSRLIYQECCYTCKFSTLNRHSDITIGDFWCYENVMKKKMSLPLLGMSLILVNTDKGKNIIEKMKKRAIVENDIYIERCNEKRFLLYQKDFGSERNKPKNIEKFKEEYKNLGFEYILRKYAGYNFIGYLKHNIKCVVTFLGILPWISKLYKH